MAVMTETKRAKLIDGVQEKANLLETSISSVVAGYTHACFLWGAPGLGKSHLVRKMMNGLAGTNWLHHTAWATPKGLFLTLAQNLNTIHVFEDCESMLKTEKAASILRAACGAPSGGDRWVTYETQNENWRVLFTGGIVLVTNQNLARASGPMQGVASRFRPIKWEVTQDEVVATILTIAKQGWSHRGVVLTTKQCVEVADCLIDMVQDGQVEVALDIRLYTEHALPTYLYCLAEGQGDWRDVLRSKLIGTAGTFLEGQQQRTRRLEDLALHISQGSGSIKDKIQRWKEQTQLGQAIYYRHLKGAKSRV